jgi:hypothetical protein
MITAIVADSLTMRRVPKTAVVQKCARVTTIQLRTDRTRLRVVADRGRDEVKITAARATAATSVALVDQTNGLTRVRPFLFHRKFRAPKTPIRIAAPQSDPVSMRGRRGSFR